VANGLDYAEKYRNLPYIAFSSLYIMQSITHLPGIERPAPFPRPCKEVMLIEKVRTCDLGFYISIFHFDLCGFYLFYHDKQENLQYSEIRPV
jgi:hypothetical protein